MEASDDQKDDIYSDFNICTTAAHLILFGTSAWALNQISIFQHPWAKISFSLTMGHGLLGVVLHVWSRQNLVAPPDIRFAKIYWRSSLMVKSIPLLCFNLEILGIKMFNTLYTVLPILTQIRWKREEKHWNCFNVLNILVLLYLSAAKGDAWVSGSTAIGTMVHFISTRHFAFSNMKPDNVTAIGISILNLLGLQAILQS
ncbi:unnamed protein product [Hermetia illucens]|uniref:Uncharacterized protein n=1 Tax=Hermetia illucens TaxID=343691 RepID=A0A7R8V140_HERIL|nr:unnamed protein product [Hermetia illucens]